MVASQVAGPWLCFGVLPWRIGNRAWQNVFDPHSDIIVSDHDPGDIFDSIRDTGDIFDSISDPGAIFFSDCDPHPSLWLVKRLKC